MFTSPGKVAGFLRVLAVVCDLDLIHMSRVQMKTTHLIEALRLQYYTRNHVGYIAGVRKQIWDG